MPRWRERLFRCGLFAFALSGLMTALAFFQIAGLDSDVQQGLDLVKWAHRTLLPTLLSITLCAFGKRISRAVTLTLSLVLLCLCYFVAFHF